MINQLLPAFFAFAVLAGLSQQEAQSTEVPTYSYKIFDGKSLDGWTVENGCQVEVKEGNILLKAGDGWLRSDHTYQDFSLHLEWKALQQK